MTDAAGAGVLPDNDIREVVAGIGRHWGWVLAFGILSILLGIVLLVWPGRTVLVISVFFGAYLLVSGIFQIVAAFASTDAPGGFRWLAGISGFLSVLLGLFAFRSLAHSVAVLVLLIGFGWMLRGLSMLIEAIADKGMPGRGWQIFLGLLSIVASIVVLVYPAPSLVALAVVFGVWLIVLGVMEIVGAFRLRSMAASLT